jgi:hypothetical protein
MENRERDKLNRDIGSSDTDDLNRKVSGRDQEDLEDVEFGQGIGQSEKEKDEEEPISRKSGSVGSSGMKGSTGNKGGSNPSSGSLESDH